MENYKIQREFNDIRNTDYNSKIFETWDLMGKKLREFLTKYKFDEYRIKDDGYDVYAFIRNGDIVLAEYSNVDIGITIFKSDSVTFSYVSLSMNIFERIDSVTPTIFREHKNKVKTEYMSRKELIKKSPHADIIMKHAPSNFIDQMNDEVDEIDTDAIEKCKEECRNCVNNFGNMHTVKDLTYEQSMNFEYTVKDILEKYKVKSVTTPDFRVYRDASNNLIYSTNKSVYLFTLTSMVFINVQNYGSGSVYEIITTVTPNEKTTKKNTYVSMDHLYAVSDYGYLIN